MRAYDSPLLAWSGVQVGLPFFQIEGTVRLAHNTNHPPAHTRPLSPALKPTPSCVQVVEWDEVRFDVRLMQRTLRHLTAPQPRPIINHIAGG